jgi:hypothetical protein
VRIGAQVPTIGVVEMGRLAATLTVDTYIFRRVGAKSALAATSSTNI